jgi:hypothetical protein
MNRVRAANQARPATGSGVFVLAVEGRLGELGEDLAAHEHHHLSSGTSTDAGSRSFPAVDKECSFRFVVRCTSGGVGEIQQFEVR